MKNLMLRLLFYPVFFYLREIETLRLFDGNAAYFSRETSSEFYRSNKWIN